MIKIPNLKPWTVVFFPDFEPHGKQSLDVTTL